MLEKEIVNTLGWFLDPEATPAQEYRAPSWSWASVDGMVVFANGDRPEGVEVLSKIERASITPAGTSPFGGVTNAVLYLEGLVQSYPVDRDLFFADQHTTLYCSVFENGKAAMFLLTFNDGRPQLIDQRLNITGSRDRYTMMLLHKSHQESFIQVSGLILEQSSGVHNTQEGSSATYKGVGAFYVQSYISEGTDSLLEAREKEFIFLDLFQKQKIELI